MKSQWSDADARKAVKHYGKAGVAEDLALRVYTTRLLGGDPELVLHGGGNTSVKTRVPDDSGEVQNVLCVKGSGWDMGVIEPPGLPAVRLDPLMGLLARDSLSDEDMVAIQRRNLIDQASPSPSVETLLHAFLPHKFVDHTHANAVLGLSDQPDGEKICEDLYGDCCAIIPWVMPGFDLAKACARAFQGRPDVDGLVLDKHGIFTFGETARDAYEMMIKLVDKAEKRLARGRKSPFAQVKLAKKLAHAAAIAPILRGALARAGDGARPLPMIFDRRVNKDILSYVNGRELGDYGRRGTVTPDHVIRTRGLPLIVPAPEKGRLDAFARAVDEAVAEYVAAYRDYFSRNNKRFGNTKKPLDPLPRLIYVPGLGIFAAGKSAKEAKIAGDLAEATVDVVTSAEGIGRFEPLDLDGLFDMEYWSLEQAKLSKAAEKPLARRIVAITGGAGGIGRAVARMFAAEGAEVALLDLGGKGLDRAADELGAFASPCDVTDPKAVDKAFDRIAAHFGGLDILVSNAGAAWQGAIGEIDEKTLHRSFDLNFWGHQRAAQAATRIMRRQQIGGALLFNISKQAVNPGLNFGPYGIPKAAAMALMRQYALECGPDGITSNAVNADRIRSGLLTPDMIKARSTARGLSEADYMGGNLLHREVTADDVARAFLHLALSPATTGAVLTVDGGNVAAMMR